MKRAIMCVLPVGAAGGALLSLAGLVTPVVGMSLGCAYLCPRYQGRRLC